MKKIGILTWYKNYNFGTALQLVALSEILKNKGYDTYAIKYKHQETIKIPPNCITKEYAIRIVNKINRIIKKEYLINDIHKKDKFDIFQSKYIKYTDECTNMSELCELENIFDGLICGSDQIWTLNNFDPHYFLDFIMDSRKKIAYAPSMGQSQVYDTYIANRVRDNIRDIDNLSIREIQGKDIIYNLTGRNAKAVLDPTLLLEKKEWIELLNIRDNNTKPYILAFFLGHNESYWKKIINYSNKKGIELKIIPIFEYDLKRKGCLNEAIGPKEFVNLINNALYVFTDSFHACVFSIIFQKKFLAFKRFKDSDKNNENSRIYSIVKQLELPSNVIYEGKKIDMNYAIDYKKVINTVELERKKSTEYIEAALKSLPELRKMPKNVNGTKAPCCGCGACTNVCPRKCIDIIMNKEGFYQARIDESKCIGCGKCSNVCPFIIIDSQSQSINTKSLYAISSKSKDILRKSSSGGVAYMIADIYNRLGYSVIGCTYDKINKRAEYIYIEPNKPEQIYLLQGSKYLQSNMGIIDKICNEKNKMVIFGTPCQIAGIKQVISNKNIILVELICHGVPSYYLYQKYIKYICRKYDLNEKNLSIIFRDKDKGWFNKYININDSKNEYIARETRDIFYRFYEQGNCLARGCYDCRWRQKSVADLRIGDYWGEKYKNSTGVNMVIPITEKGNQIICQLQVRDTCKIEKNDITDYFKYQQIKNHPRPTYYEELIYDLKNSQIELEQILNKYIVPYEERKKLIKVYAKIKEVFR